jgi:iron complex outermembrane receptor protein
VNDEELDRVKSRGSIILMALLVVLACLDMMAGPARADAPDLTQFSIEDLMQVKVVSAAKVEQALEDTAAAVFVMRPTTSAGRG